jgi:hypothetical protein
MRSGKNRDLARRTSPALTSRWQVVCETRARQTCPLRRNSRRIFYESRQRPFKSCGSLFVCGQLLHKRTQKSKPRSVNARQFRSRPRSLPPSSWLWLAASGRFFLILGGDGCYGGSFAGMEWRRSFRTGGPGTFRGPSYTVLTDPDLRAEK